MITLTVAVDNVYKALYYLILLSYVLSFPSDYCNIKYTSKYYHRFSPVGNKCMCLSKTMTFRYMICLPT